MTRIRTLLCLFTLLAGTAASSAAGAAPVQAEHVEAELISERTAAVPGETTWVALRLRPDPQWHTYWRNPGDSGLATRLEWTLPDGVSAGEIHWPYPHREALGELTNYGYSAETLHLVPIGVPAVWPAGVPLARRARASWLVCKDICIPGQAELGLDLPTQNGAAAASIWAPFFAEARAQVPVPVDWPARFEVGAEALSLAVEAAALPAAAAIEFFPYDNGLVRHAAPQRLARDGDRLRLSQALSDYFVAAGDRVEGVLVVRAAGAGASAYRITAVPGAVEAVPAAAAGASDTPAPTAGAAAGRASPGLPAALVFAFLGGLILNLMPCVFPVLSIKAVSLLESHDDRRRQLQHALVYTLGVLVCFALLAGVLLSLRGGGDAIGWGFQLQQPLFVAALAYLFFAMALSLSGVVHFGTRMMGVGQSLTVRGGLRGSFFTGVLAVVVASPCSAPFMGVALGYALTQPPAAAIAIFLALGLGLAAPFLAIGLVPALARLLPRPGAWMETFKQLMAFPLYLTVIWLLWVLGGLTDRSGMALAGCGLVLVAFVAWLWQRPGLMPNLLKTAAAIGALAILAHPLLRSAAPPGTVAADAAWQTYSAERLAEARQQGRTVFVNFTADWCITCKVNERVALSSARVQQAFAEHGVVYLKGDWTRSDPAITAVLDHYQRSGVPLYLLFRDGGEAQVLPQLLTPDIVIDHLRGGPA